MLHLSTLFCNNLVAPKKSLASDHDITPTFLMTAGLLWSTTGTAAMKISRSFFSSMFVWMLRTDRRVAEMKKLHRRHDS